MNFSFADKTPEQVVELVSEALGGRELGKILNLELQPSAQALEVTINKMGQSKLFFDYQTEANQVNFQLKKEKIAFSHKLFKPEIEAKLKSVLAKLGAHVTA